MDLHADCLDHEHVVTRNLALRSCRGLAAYDLGSRVAEGSPGLLFLGVPNGLVECSRFV